MKQQHAIYKHLHLALAGGEFDLTGSNAAGSIITLDVLRLPGCSVQVNSTGLVSNSIIHVVHLEHLTEVKRFSR